MTDSNVHPVIFFFFYNFSDLFLILFILQVVLKLNHLPLRMSLPVMKEDRANQRKINSDFQQTKSWEILGMNSYEDLDLGFFLKN